MCGIVLFRQGKGTATISQIISLATRIKHRGQDGIGILYEKDDGKLSLIKNLYKLEEVNTGILEKSNFIKRVRIGSFEYVQDDMDSYEKGQKKFNKYVDKFNDISSGFIALHHRKGTAGEIELKNQHPIYIDGKYYIHNGTAYEYSSVRKYLEVVEGVKFDTETDTEVLARLYNILKGKELNDEDLYNTFYDMFPDGFGLLVEIDKEKNVTFLKDSSRDIWHYVLDDDSDLFISEPVADIQKYKTAGKLTEGINYIDKVDEYDYTEVCRKNLEWWNHIMDKYRTIFPKEETCKFCNKTKSVVGTFYLDDEHNLSNGGSTTKYVCFECMINEYKNDDSDEDIDDEEKRVNLKKAKFGRKVGLNKKFEVVNDDS